jgi:glycosyltransferase involved in cell wall biosynthesis
MNVCVIIPAYNEEKTIASVVDSLPADVDVIVVDDGSTDGTGEEVKKTRATLIRQEQNKGYCEAIQSGLRDCRSDIIVTLDGDGQHNAQDVARLIDTISVTGADLVLGSRFKGLRRRDLYDIVVERFFSLLIFMVCGKWLSDCSCGLKAFRLPLARLVPPVNKRAGWHQLICVVALRYRLNVIEVPITVAPRQYGISKVRKPSALFRFLMNVVTAIITFRRKKI